MIIHSLLDQDLYKLTVGQFFFQHFPRAKATYKFKNRKNADLCPYVDDIRLEINALGNLRFSLDELVYLESLNLFSCSFMHYLRSFKFDPANEVSVYVKDEKLCIDFSGDLMNIWMYEIFVLAIVQEVYGRHQNADMSYALKSLQEKTQKIVDNDLDVIEFGTRRRHSFVWQNEVICTMSHAGAIKTTSNMFFAKKFGLNCSGTMPHELYQACQAAYGAPRLRDFQTFALENWFAMYGEKLAIALTDIVGMNAFLDDFMTQHLYDSYRGCRHDSGCPFEWTRRLLEFYDNLGVDSMQKIAVYSDGLDVDKAIVLKRTFSMYIQTKFGIGTNLTNDMGYDPLAIVIKMITCDGQHTAKIPDVAGKTMCESPIFEAHLKEVFGIQ